ncbi:MAG: hypothetical protein KF861_07280 [Planctomycetaceae bacterium]|nr:hypothetical protein [Planctomycetaceae bacterium]
MLAPSDIDGDGIRNFDDANLYRHASYERIQRRKAGYEYGLHQADDFVGGVWQGMKQGARDTVDTARTLPGQIVDAAKWLWDRAKDPIGTGRAIGSALKRGAQSQQRLSGAVV